MASSCDEEVPEEIAEVIETLPEELDYNLHVKPILSDKCFACHGPDKAKQKAGLQLNISEAAFAELPESPGKVAIDPGSLKGSEIYHRIMSTDPDKIMPTPESHLTLTNYEKAVLVRWIKEGAEYKPHWALEKIKKPQIPSVQNEDWPYNPIDKFILKNLEQKKLQPSELASKELLLRRVTFDLTGLPPSLEEIENFKNDQSEKAYEKVVDRLLASPHYGERMAAEWLDVARFADTHGYTVDRERDMSPYRDFVINAFNRNQSYDEFLHWQLAGDLMPNPTKEMLIATAFNRNHQQNMEGGIIEKEFQTEYVLDRTDTFGSAFLGISVGCARCHDHKYDPFSQKNYYELYSFFNNVNEAGQISWDDAMPTPTLMLPTEEEEKLVSFIQNDLTSLEKKVVQVQKKGASDFDKWIQNRKYQNISSKTIPQEGLTAAYTFDKSNLTNELNSRQNGRMVIVSGPAEKPIFKNSPKGKSLLLNGDAWLDSGGAGVFAKSDPFSVSIEVNISNEIPEGVILHKGISERLYNYKGYNLYINSEGKLEANLVHTAPGNAIKKVSEDKILRDEWLTLTMTYDGSSKARGLKVYLNGDLLKMTIATDNLFKDILFDPKVFKEQPSLQVGAWERGFGLKNSQVDNIYVWNRTLTPYESKIVAGKATWKTLTSKSPSQLNEKEKEALQAYYFSTQHAPTLALLKQLQSKRKSLTESIEPIQELMVMKEMDEPKRSFLLERGNYDALGEEVFPNTAENILPIPETLPRNRYGLAQWLTLPEHPLTARVAVNRFWQNIFGTGLVKTAEDFGNQGELPSHPYLLDYLAASFMETGWDVKALLKEMVMSKTYQQSSQASKEQLASDPENRLLARGPALRLTAEMIRDNALAASGLLVKEIGGKSIKPYQPDGLWRINGAHYKQDTGQAVYRRSVYVFVKRSVPHPTLATFDGTSRSYCNMSRQKTNTPLQALVTLNDPTFIEACKVLGEQMLAFENVDSGIKSTYQKLTGKKPSPEELNLLKELHENEMKRFTTNPGKAKGWLDAGYYEIKHPKQSIEIASNAVVASVIMNSDATITKR